MKKIIVVSLLLLSCSYGQSKFNIYSGINYPIGTNAFANSLSEIYYPGYNLGASYNYYFTNNFSLSPSIEFSNYIFDNFKIGASIPEISFVSSSGTSTQIYKVGFNIKFFPKISPAPQGFVFTGLSWNIVNPGNIELKYRDMNNGDFQIIKKLDIKNYLTQIIGVGVNLFNFSSLSLAIEGIISTNYSDRTTGSANLGIYF